MEGWNGAENFQGIAISLDSPYSKKYGTLLSYNFRFSSYTGKYQKIHRAIENGDIGYDRKEFPVRTLKNGEIVNLNLHYEMHGKENYRCEVSESKFLKYGIYTKAYICYKFSPDHIKYKSITIKLIYTKSPNLPAKYKKLAKEYTYQDMQQRAKRVLDSLYIKDGW